MSDFYVLKSTFALIIALNLNILKNLKSLVDYDCDRITFLYFTHYLHTNNKKYHCNGINGSIGNLCCIGTTV